MCHNVISATFRNKMVYTILCILCLYVTLVNAQQEALRMMYPMMPMSINPAQAGSSKVASIVGFYRKKPLFSLPGLVSLSQQYLSFDMPIQQESWGVGFLGFNSSQAFADGSGAIASNLGLAGVVSKRFQLGERHELSVGGNIGVNQKPVITSNGTTVLSGSYGFGLMYQRDHFKFGVSRPSTYMSGTSVSPLYAHTEAMLNLSSGDKFRFGSVLKYVKSGAFSETNIDFYGVYWFQEVVGIGAWYMNTGAEAGNTALLGSAQVALTRNFMVTYAYDFLGKSITLNLPGSNTSNTSNSNSGFHQIGIRYEIDMGNGKLANFRP